MISNSELKSHKQSLEGQKIVPFIASIKLMLLDNTIFEFIMSVLSLSVMHSILDLSFNKYVARQKLNWILIKEI